MRTQLTVLMLLAVQIGSLSAQNAAQFPGAEPPEAIAAKVNGESITVREIDAILKRTLRGAPLLPSQLRDLRRALLEDLIEEKLLSQFLDKNAPKVDAAELDAQLAALRVSLVKENMSLEEHLHRSNQTESQLREEWKTRIQLMHYVKELASDEKLKAYHAANRDHFDRTEVRVSHILIRLGKDASAVERAVAKEKLQRIRGELVSGHLTFAAAAKKYSQCPSALKDGDLGFIRRRGLPEDEPLARSAFALKVSELSDVIKTERGLHLLKMTERKPGTPTVLEECVVEVLESFAEDTRTELVEKLRKASIVQIKLR
jgi:parvulin-like peptidyl-prolyl isomerase